MEAACLANIARVEDPEVRALLTPDHPWGCKRPLLSNDFYPAFNRPNLELVSDRIERITKAGVVTQGGRERRLSIDARAGGAYKRAAPGRASQNSVVYGPNINSDSIIRISTGDTCCARFSGRAEPA
jgi:cation diffusion facilitator CzcD-associated flavoprotein CzcO